MILHDALIQASQQRFDRGFRPQAVAKQLPDGPRGAHLDQKWRRRRYQRLLEASGDPQQASQALERIIQGNDLVSINYLAIGLSAARSVGRIHLLDGSGRTIGYGTGFLVGPGVLMTNNHVIGSDITGANALVEFDYEYDATGRDRPSVFFKFDPAAGFVTDQDLDFTLIAVAERSAAGDKAATEYGWLPLKDTPGKAFEGEYLTIVQHPGGERKQVCVRENKLLKYEDKTVWYQTDTVAGSSGSPVFNNAWEVVALHHTGVPKTNAKGQWLTVDDRVWDPSMDDTRVKWLANEGIRISRIVEFLGQSDDPAARRVLNAGQSAGPIATSADGAESKRDSTCDRVVADDATGTISVTLPLRVSLQLGEIADRLGQARAAADRRLPPPGPAAGDDQAIEAVIIDQTNYAKRKGYSATFLGAGELAVPMPRLTPATKRVTLKVGTGSGDQAFVLKYYNYSVVMNKQRRIATFAAVNIDGALRRDLGKREGDRWYFDTRIAEKFQIGNDFYKGQTLDEARKTPFDRGHLVRRLDATWGVTDDFARTQGNDTFHFTNCSPQHMTFNQGKKLWAGIEDYVLSQVEGERKKACVINGAVFRDDDESFGHLKIPRQFWKVAVFVKGGKLAAAAFVLSQEPLLRGITSREAKFSPLKDAEAKAFQVKIGDLARLTQLDFGKLATHDTARAAPEALGMRPIESLSEIRL